MLKCNVDVTFRTALSEEISHASHMLKSFVDERFTRAGVITEKLALLPKSAELHGSANGVDSKALAEVLSSKSAENWCFAAFAIVGALAASVVTAEKLALLPKSAELHGFSNSTDYKALTKMASSKSAELSDIDHDAPPNLGAQAAKVQK